MEAEEPKIKKLSKRYKNSYNCLVNNLDDGCLMLIFNFLCPIPAVFIPAVLAQVIFGMRGKKKTAVGPSQTNHNIFPHQPQVCFEGETLTSFLKLVHREIESARVVEETLPLKFWIKQQFAIGVNEVTRGLERMPSNHGAENSSDEVIGTNVNNNGARCGSFQARCGSLQAILLASDCNPRTLTKHLPALAASRNVPLIFVKDKKEGSLRLGELIKVKTAIAIGIKAKGNSINRLIEETLIDH